MAFWLIAGLLGLFMFASSAPSPLYAVYESRWHFSPATLTAVFAVYAVAMLAALLVFGSLSDHIGRRPVILAALLGDVLAMMLFLLAHGTPLLYAARALQGLATGTATSALSASLLELQPVEQASVASLVNSCAPAVGLAAGGLGTSALVQYGPAPTRLVYWLLLGALLLGALGVAAMSDPGVRRPGGLASPRPQASVPRAARSAFAIATPCLIALWALGGLYLSLGPSLAAQLVGSSNRLWGGLLIFLLMGTGSVAPVLGRRSTPERAMAVGCATLLAGVGVTLAAIELSLAALLLGGTALAGVGFGLAFLGAFRMVTAFAPPAERAGLIATVYVLSYLAFSVPVVIAGVVATHVGLRDTSLGYAAAVAALTATAVVGSLHRHTRHKAPATHPVEMPPCPCTVPAVPTRS